MGRWGRGWEGLAEEMMPQLWPEDSIGAEKKSQVVEELAF